MRRRSFVAGGFRLRVFYLEDCVCLHLTYPSGHIYGLYVARHEWAEERRIGGVIPTARRLIALHDGVDITDSGAVEPVEGV